MLTLPLLSQMADDWTTTYCINEDGFPKVLYAAIMRLGIPERPEYVGREFMEHDTKSCKIFRERNSPPPPFRLEHPITFKERRRK